MLLALREQAQVVVLPRVAEQRAELERAGGFIVPERAIDAQSLIAYADLVISAGGTMNREAVALGTPVFTTFEGRLGAVDEDLIATGRLRQLTSADEVARDQARSGRRQSPSASAATRASCSRWRWRRCAERSARPSAGSSECVPRWRAVRALVVLRSGICRRRVALQRRSPAAWCAELATVPEESCRDALASVRRRECGKIASALASRAMPSA